MSGTYTVREDVQRHVNQANKAVKDAQEQAIKEMQNGYGTLTTYQVERVLSAQKTANLWNNVARVITFNDEQEEPEELAAILTLIKEEVEETMMRYSTTRSTSLLTILNDDLAQVARVEFRGELRWLIKAARQEQNEINQAEAAAMIAELEA